MTLFVNDALRKAARHAKRGEIELAIQKYNSVLEKFPKNRRAIDGLKALRQSGPTSVDSPQEQVNGLVALYNRGEFRDVIVHGEALALKFPAIPVIQALIGAANAGLGRLEEAVVIYNKALQLKPDFAEVHNNLGAALNELGRYEKAVSSFARALAITPDFALAHNNLGNALKSLGRPEEALASYDRALEIQPDYAEAHNNLGNSLTELGRLEEAVASYGNALQIAPDFAVAHNNLGNALHDLGRVEKAIESFEAALNIEPELARAHNNLGNALYDLGERDAAIASFTRALQIDPELAGAHRNLSVTRKYREGDPQIRQMLQLIDRQDLADQDRMLLSFALGKVYEDLGDYDTAFSRLCEGNRLLRDQRKYESSAARASFAKIRSWFEGDVPVIATGDEDSAENGPRPVFVLGMPRSGTTLVEQILASHSLVHGAGELTLLERSVNAIEQGAMQLSATRLRSVGRSYLSGLAELGASEPCITDKMPLNFRWIGFICTTMPEARIVHVKRDARATCWSIFKHYFSRQGHGFANDLQDVADYYRLYVELMAFWQTRFPGRIYDLDYEALTEHQQEETRKLLEHAGLEWEDACLDFHKTRRAVRTSSATQVRQKMYQGSSEAWRKFEKHLAPMLEPLSDLG